MLRWPTFHLSVLAQQVRNNWSRLGALLAEPEAVGLLESLHATMQADVPARTSLLATDKSLLRQFLDSAQRFNRGWQAYLEGLDLEPVNKPRRDFNQFYVLEKSCAFASEKSTAGFEPLAMLERAHLYERFPLLMLPTLK
jgi:hypothetical protein